MKKILLTPLLTLLFLGVNQAAMSQEIGLASYYADKFQGRKTASGAKYDRKEMTCAHNTYPFGTLLKVTRLDNQKSVIVKVIDRGPHVSGRIVDVSWAAAKKLDLLDDGVAKVKVEVYKSAKKESNPKKPSKELTNPPKNEREIPTSYGSEAPLKKKAENPDKNKEVKEKKSTPALRTTSKSEKKPASSPTTAGTYKEGNGLYHITITSSPGGFATQIGSYTDFDNAVKEITRLHAKGFKDVLVKMETPPNGITRYKLLVGLRSTRKDAEVYKDNLLKKYKIKGFVIEVRP